MSTLDESLPGLVSSWSTAVGAAVLIIVPQTSLSTVNSMKGLTRLNPSKEPTVQTPVPLLYVPEPVLAEGFTLVTPDGSRSVTTMPVAVFSERLLTTML